jgi:hypothetical protein
VTIPRPEYDTLTSPNSATQLILCIPTTQVILSRTDYTGPGKRIRCSDLPGDLRILAWSRCISFGRPPV